MASDTPSTAPTPALCPFTVVIDTREQQPYGFAGLNQDAGDGGGGPLAVPTARGTLRSGDYSIAGHTTDIAIERKSLSDLYGTVGRSRGRFERELLRLADMPFALVVVEATWEDAVVPPDYSRLAGKTVFRSVLAWMQRHPTVHWQLCGTRRFAEVLTFRTLERFWRVKQKELRDERAGAG